MTETPGDADNGWWWTAMAGVLGDDPGFAFGVFDENLRHVAVNAALVTLNGVTDASDLLGRTPLEVHGPAVQEAQDTFAAVLSSGRPLRSQPFDGVLNDRSHKLRRWTLDCLPLRGGGHRGVVVMVHEVAPQLPTDLHWDATVRELRHAADHDELTGLANRRVLYRVLQQRLGRGDAVSVVFCDLDEFKEINDRHGHAAGDRVLQAAATRLQGVVQPFHTLLARHGGDEFVAVCGSGKVRALLAAISSAFEEPFEVDGWRGWLSVSVGVADAHPGDSADELVAAADARMYDSKRIRSGPDQEGPRNRVRSQ